MSNLIPMNEAAKMLGMSVEQLTELRSNNEIFGYRDGSNWKFKISELERVAGEMGISLATGHVMDEPLDEVSGSGFDMSDSSKDMIIDDDSSSGSLSGSGDSGEYMEDSSVELFQNPLSQKPGTGDSSIDLDDDDAISLSDRGRLDQGTSKSAGDDAEALKLDGGDGIAASDRDVIDDDDDELSFGSSSLRLASESSKKVSDDLGSDVLDEEVEKGESSSDTGKMLGADDDDLLMSEDDLFSDEMSIADSSSFEDSAELSSDFDDSSDMVLEDSDSSTEIKLEANESGINLSANESGISLADEPLELGGSDIDSLELPEDDEMIVLEDAVGPDEATLMQEDDFNLTPLEASLEEDESSGSQVIALEDSEIYADESAGTILGEEDFEAQPALLDDTMGGGFYDEAGLMPGQMMVPAGAAALPEAPYSTWQVVGLGLVTALLLAGSMVAYNLCQNMWMPDDQIIGRSVLNFFLKLTGMNN
jgi:hypothetical protein